MKYLFDYLLSIMSQETEPSLSEYARFYGLSIDHLEGNPLADLVVDNYLHDELEDPEDVFKIDDVVDVNLTERLEAGEDEAALLAFIKNVSYGSLTFDHDLKLDTHRIRNMKAELPILSTDQETDMLDFAAPVVPDLANEHLPFESVDEEADEGLTWPSHYFSLPNEYMAKVKNEVLEMSEGLVRYMQETLNFSADEALPTFDVEVSNYKRVSVIYLLIR